MAEGAKSADAKLASDVADKSLQDSSETAKAAEDAHEDDEGEEEEGEDEVEGEQSAQAGAEGASSTKKKKKPKKKKKKAATAGPEGTEEGGTAASQAKAAPNANQARDIQNLLQQLAMSNQQGRKAEGKKPEDYKFWNTQPVPKFKEPDLLQTTDDAQAEGPILPDKVCRAAAKAEPEKLLEGFEWCLVDLDDDKELEELYDLLDNHYVEDTDGSFRFKYSKQFLSWALKPPGWRRDWHIGVRTATKEGKKGKLVAFIAGIPVTLKTGDQKFDATEINFLTIHRRLRGKRLAPVLIKEVTRQCYRNGIYQALYTAGTLLPTPITTGRYFHRSLDWEHLYKTGFSHLPPGSSELRQKFKYKLEPTTGTKGLRPMEPRDVDAVMDLLVRYLERFHLRQEWSREEIAHWLCSEASKGVVWSFVVESEGGRITDFMSYYLLESTVLRAPNQTATIRAAYLYYYATETAFPPVNPNAQMQTTRQSSVPPVPTSAQQEQLLAARLQQLMHDALILAKKEDFHVFNAVTILDNPLFLKEQKFEPGDGKLHFYLFNWRTKALGGGIDARSEIDRGKMGGVGVVML